MWYPVFFYRLWKQKCKQANIEEEPVTPVKNGRRRSNNAQQINQNTKAANSPFKKLYMTKQRVYWNWRMGPLRPSKVLKGHDDHVITCLQFCGSKIVSGSDDGTLKVWSAISGKCLRTLVGHTGGVWSSQLSGNIIVSGSTDRTLKVWNADTGYCMHTLYGHSSTVRCMDMHDSTVVSGSRDGTLRVWDTSSGNCLHVLVGHLAAVRWWVKLSVYRHVEQHVYTDNVFLVKCQQWELDRRRILAVSCLKYFSMHSWCRVCSDSSNSHIRIYSVNLTEIYMYMYHSNNPPAGPWLVGHTRFYTEPKSNEN